ncbi:MAG: DNA repair protein RecO [Paracoccaceae bacterium]|nr:MAG: DNA repair protein RecO [Paracoccaceae bacterium]
MDWQDEGTLLAMRPHGETSAIVEVFTLAHGRHAGVVRGGAGRRMAPVLQPGAHLAVAWRARLSDHLGAFTVEPLRSRASVMADADRLAVLSAVCAMLRMALPEREAHPALWSDTTALLDGLAEGTAGLPAYLPWEMRLLADLGFGLDLGSCAVTGSRDDLAFVSPRTGRAVSRTGAGDWADRLLPLPDAVRRGLASDPAEILQGLAITGHFLLREMEPLRPGPGLPEARARLVARLSRR